MDSSISEIAISGATPRDETVASPHAAANGCATTERSEPQAASAPDATSEPSAKSGASDTAFATVAAASTAASFNNIAAAEDCDLAMYARDAAVTLARNDAAGTFSADKPDNRSRDTRTERQPHTHSTVSSGGARTLVVYDDRLLAHVSPEGHVEACTRVLSIHGQMERDGLLAPDRVHVCTCEYARMEDVLAVHTHDHVHKVMATDPRPPRAGVDAAGVPHGDAQGEVACSLGQLLRNTSDLRAYVSATDLHFLDGDLRDMYASRHTLGCAMLAAGGVKKAVQGVVQGLYKNAFAVVRPPGHHCSACAYSGFCFFNNVAVAARYAQRELGVGKVCIVDWDVHHGDGTQQIFYDDPSVLLISLHRRTRGFFPSNPTETGFIEELGAGAGTGFNVNIPWPVADLGDHEYAAAFDYAVLPIVSEFEPELIIVSAGFDAADGDYLGGMHVSSRMYYHLTHALASLKPSKGLVLALEGGYNLDSIKHAASACLRSLIDSASGAGTVGLARQLVFGDDAVVRTAPARFVPPERAPGNLVHPAAVLTLQSVAAALAPYWSCMRTLLSSGALLPTRVDAGEVLVSLPIKYSVIIPGKITDSSTPTAATSTPPSSKSVDPMDELTDSLASMAVGSRSPRGPTGGSLYAANISLTELMSPGTGAPGRRTTRAGNTRSSVTSNVQLLHKPMDVTQIGKQPVTLNVERRSVASTQDGTAVFVCMRDGLGRCVLEYQLAPPLAGAQASSTVVASARKSRSAPESPSELRASTVCRFTVVGASPGSAPEHVHLVDGTPVEVSGHTHFLIPPPSMLPPASAIWEDERVVIRSTSPAQAADDEFAVGGNSDAAPFAYCLRFRTSTDTKAFRNAILTAHGAKLVSGGTSRPRVGKSLGKAKEAISDDASTARSDTGSPAMDPETQTSTSSPTGAAGAVEPSTMPAAPVDAPIAAPVAALAPLTVSSNAAEPSEDAVAPRDTPAAGSDEAYEPVEDGGVDMSSCFTFVAQERAPLPEGISCVAHMLLLSIMPAPTPVCGDEAQCIACANAAADWFGRLGTDAAASGSAFAVRVPGALPRWSAMSDGTFSVVAPASMDSKFILTMHNESVERQIASLTKCMTAIIVLGICDALQLKGNAAPNSSFLLEPGKGVSSRMAVSARGSAARGGTVALIEPGEVFTVWDMLHGMMLPSGNDAATALADAFGHLFAPESEDAWQPFELAAHYDNGDWTRTDPVSCFVAEMNRTAKVLGMNDTVFANPHGLVHQRHHSTATDVARMVAAGLADERFRKLVRTLRYQCDAVVPPPAAVAAAPPDGTPVATTPSAIAAVTSPPAVESVSSSETSNSAADASAVEAEKRQPIRGRAGTRGRRGGAASTASAMPTTAATGAVRKVRWGNTNSLLMKPTAIRGFTICGVKTGITPGAYGCLVLHMTGTATVPALSTAPASSPDTPAPLAPSDDAAAANVTAPASSATVSARAHTRTRVALEVTSVALGSRNKSMRFIDSSRLLQWAADALQLVGFELD